MRSIFRGGHNQCDAGLHHSPRAGQEWEELDVVLPLKTNEAVQ
jgi:hypothetical protein